MNNIKIRVLILPVVGALGAIVALVWPVGHKAFCAGLAAVVI
jgi:hypothetical protein